MNDDEKSIDQEPAVDAKETRGAKALRLLRAGSKRGASRDIGILLAVLLNLAFMAHPLQWQAPEQAQAAKVAMQAWPAALRRLEVKGVPACDGGPAISCAEILTSRQDEVNNTQEGAVSLWAAQNWSQAWMPFSQWRVAHSVALAAPQSDYGRHLLASRAQQAGLLVEPAPELAAAYSEADDATPPMRVQTDHGMVAFFSDGMSLPTMEDRGQWKILAQGPANQAARMAAAMSNLSDPGPVEVAVAIQGERAAQARDEKARQERAALQGASGPLATSQKG